MSHILPLVQKCFVKMLFNRKQKSVAESYSSKVTGLSPATLLQQDSARVFSCIFIPEYSRTAASKLSLIQLTFSTKSKFSLFYHREMEILFLFSFYASISCSCKHNCATFINTEIFLILFQIQIYIYIYMFQIYIYIFVLYIYIYIYIYKYIYLKHLSNF